jgi:hypothetical protein
MSDLRQRALARNPVPIGLGTATSGHVPGEYDGLSGTFANACRAADREYRQQQSKRPAATPRSSGALAVTVEALMGSLRTRRTLALEEPDTRRRISQLADEQVVEVADRLQKLPLEEPWSDEEIDQFFIARNQCVAKNNFGIE